MTCDELYLSPVSGWEIAVKQKIGKLSLPAPAPEWVPSQRVSHGIDTLPLSEGAALFVSTLPNHHKDPFDRMLVAQALYDDLVLLTPDPFIRAYPAKVEW